MRYRSIGRWRSTGTIANRAELKGTRERLPRQLRKVFLDGEHDPHRLTGSLICRASIANGTANRRPPNG